MFISDHIVEFIRKKLPPDAGILAELRFYAEEHNIPVAKPETAALLRFIGTLKRPRRVLEAGTAIGYSSIVLASCLAPGGRIDTIEKDEDLALMARANIARSGYEKSINVIVADVLEVFPCLENGYDLVFLDAGKGHYYQLLMDAARILNPGGVLIADNILFMGKVAQAGHIPHKHRTIVTNMRAFIEELCASPDFETALLTVGDGVAVAVKK